MCCSAACMACESSSILAAQTIQSRARIGKWRYSCQRILRKGRQRLVCSSLHPHDPTHAIAEFASQEGLKGAELPHRG